MASLMSLHHQLGIIHHLTKKLVLENKIESSNNFFFWNYRVMISCFDLTSLNIVLVYKWEYTRQKYYPVKKNIHGHGRGGANTPHNAKKEPLKCNQKGIITLMFIRSFISAKK